ncbi:hypothetical protein FRC14_000968 [Serendipita sp. 396]|nr:hypothetical protein FRC14_000968 [Serendipita sp. 396]KAG8775086.1 hypothetical protein FRC15_000792 [Serendipita sp. 397]KAG8794643.1 hypothetical protein FRC16_010418 [Serendipita sp. 398]KAG8817842.1 hypothetical protein FRC18_000334 [Serendipita sp. 400]KAG8822697.1 hypothetical protein FRC19_005420 [Serendipita sp. 401]KAG8849113.1 hypothetical protein FRB91_010225 [Serendipita sp. 411]KAG8855209.1 hypothetical protein FRC20_000829 [Serendipita sp. 405]KAG9054551.1 hypothetical prot
MPHHQSKRSPPVPAPTRPKSSTKTNGPSSGTQKHKNGPHGSPESLSSATPEPGTSHGTPPHADAYHYSKKLTKVIRGTTGGRNAKSKAKTRKMHEGPEAELSEEEEEDVYTDVEDSVLNVVGDTPEVQPCVQPSFNMQEFVSTAKVYSDSHNISRGYEMITSPSARLVIPLDDASPITGKRPIIGHLESIVASISSLSDDSEWENVQFEMDGLNELVSLPLSEAKVGYAAALKNGGAKRVDSVEGVWCRANASCCF